ncbi:hypothetical protein Tco_1028413 [Tanacetum coccineum]|uniref:Uncharacterized protein n=1 Tax=Tanacetum coccineum TaxID=301880 RepID=A0ABQ5G2P7_9ASTR
MTLNEFGKDEILLTLVWQPNAVAAVPDISSLFVCLFEPAIQLFFALLLLGSLFPDTRMLAGQPQPGHVVAAMAGCFAKEFKTLSVAELGWVLRLHRGSLGAEQDAENGWIWVMLMEMDACVTRALSFKAFVSLSKQYFAAYRRGIITFDVMRRYCASKDIRKKPKDFANEHGFYSFFVMCRSSSARPGVYYRVKTTFWRIKTLRSLKYVVDAAKGELPRRVFERNSGTDCWIEAMVWQVIRFAAMGIEKTKAVMIFFRNRIYGKRLPVSWLGSHIYTVVAAMAGILFRGTTVIWLRKFEPNTIMRRSDSVKKLNLAIPNKEAEVLLLYKDLANHCDCYSIVCFALTAAARFIDANQTVGEKVTACVPFDGCCGIDRDG